MDLLAFIFSKMALFYRPLTGSTQKQRVLDLLRSTYVFDVDVNLFTEDARVACADVSKSVSLIPTFSPKQIISAT